MLSVSKSAIKEIAESLKQGKIIAFPTDTVFGIACIYNDFKAIKRIKEIKKRSLNKSLPMMCSSIEMLLQFADVSKDNLKIIKTYPKGAITYILKLKEGIDKRICDNKDTIAIRIPDDDFIIKLIDYLQVPLLVTSANRSNAENLCRYDEVAKVFKDEIDLIVEGDAKAYLASTIYDCINKKVIRQGSIFIKEDTDG